MLRPLVADRGLRAGASRIHSFPRTQARQRTRVTGLSKSQAEQLLDWLEANGYRDYDLAYSAGKMFTVSFAKDDDAA
jgi:hypothetical protein